MDADDHNNPHKQAAANQQRRQIDTLQHLSEFIAECASLPAARRPYVISALKRARELLSNGAVDVRADPKTVLQQLDRFSPTMAGMTTQSFANLKSRVRLAFRFAAPQLAPARSHTRLTGAWAAIDVHLGRKDRFLSRFLRFGQACGLQPKDIRQQHLQRFETFLRDEVIADRTEKIVRATAQTWNRLSTAHPEFELAQLSVPPLRRQPYWIRLDDLTSALQQEIEQYLDRRAHPDPFLANCSRPLAVTTVQQYRNFFV